MIIASIWALPMYSCTRTVNKKSSATPASATLVAQAADDLTLDVVNGGRFIANLTVICDAATA